MKNTYRFTTNVWLYNGDSPWHFATISKALSKEIKQNLLFKPKGFGSIPVEVKTGKSKWKTSIFLDKNETYILPLKKEIRKAENILSGNKYSFTITTLL